METISVLKTLSLQSLGSTATHQNKNVNRDFLNAEGGGATRPGIYCFMFQANITSNLN